MNGILAGRRAYVTGGSSGIGAAIVKTFAQEGARVAIGASRHADEARATARDLPCSGGKHIVVQAQRMMGGAKWCRPLGHRDARRAGPEPEISDVIQPLVISMVDLPRLEYSAEVIELAPNCLDAAGSQVERISSFIFCRSSGDHFSVSS